MKEKLKLIKASLKIWHQQHTHNLESRIKDVKDRITSLDHKGEAHVLDMEEVEELHSLSAILFSMAKINTSLQLQKSRLKWLK